MSEDRSDISANARSASMAIWILAMILLVGGSAGAMAQDKPLIRKWLDGEVQASFPKITYSGAPITLRYSTFIKEFQIDVDAFKLLEKATNGKLVVKPYWGNSLADAQRGAFDAVSAGIADFGNCYVQYVPAGFKYHGLLQIPFTFTRSAQASYVATQMYPKYIKPQYEAKNVYLARINMTRPAHLLTKKPVRAMDDLKGQKAYILGSPYMRALAEALGMVPTSITPTEVYTAMQSGVLDVVPSHDASFLLFKWMEVGKYLTDAPLWTSSLEYCLNKGTFERMPPDLKKVFYHWLQLVNQAYSELFFDNVSDKARDLMKKRGIEFIELSKEQQELWRAATEKATENYIKSLNDPRAEEFVRELRRLAKEAGAMTDDQITQRLLEQPVPGLIDF